MGKLNCVSITKEVEKLAEELGISSRMAAVRIAIWQNKTNKPEQYPTKEELVDLKEVLDTNDKVKKSLLEESNLEGSIFSVGDINTSLKYDRLRFIYTPYQKNLRVKRLANQFSSIVTKAHKATPNISNRRELISLLTPSSIVDTIKSYYSNWLESSDTDKYDTEWNNYTWLKEDTEEQVKEKDKIVRDNIEYKTKEYKKILSNFNALMSEAAIVLRTSEGIILSKDGIDVKKAEETTDINEEDTKSPEFNTEALEQEVKESWMIKDKSVSTLNKAGQELKSMLNNIVEVDKESRIIVDDLGTPMTVGINKIHAILLSAFKGETNPSNVFNVLNKVANTHYWGIELIEKLEDNELLLNQFYSTYFNQNNSYTVLFTEDGKVKTKVLTKDSGAEFFTDSWRNNRTSNIVLNPDTSIYDNVGNIDTNKFDKAYSKIEDIKSLINTIQRKDLPNELEVDELKELFSNNKVREDLLGLLEGVGVSTSPNDIASILDSSSKGNYIGLQLFNPIYNIYHGLKLLRNDKKSGNNLLQDKNISWLDTEYKTAFNKLGTLFDNIIGTTTEGSVVEKNIVRYSYSSPSYMSVLLDKLKSFNTKEEAREFLMEEFLYDEFFGYKNVDGNVTILNRWLDKLYSNPSGFASLLDSTTVLHFNGIPYIKWNPLQVFQVQYEMFNSSLSGKDAWYITPIMSDSPVAQFVKAEKLSDDIVKKEMLNLALQEIIRIKRVLNRDRLYKEGSLAKKDLIEFYDIAFSKDNLGGSVFKFLPSLNNYLEEFMTNSTLFSENPSIEDIQVLEEYINSSLEESFTSYTNNLVNEGLLTKDSYDRTKYGIRENTSIPGDIAVKDKENLKNFYLNSIFANAQMIQLFTTDLAYYSSITDFQKRFKQVYTPSKKPYTEAMYNGEKVGTKNERYIVLKDENVKSTILNEMKAALLTQADKGLITSEEVGEILSNYQSNNITDGQAFRSLDSTRKVDIMFGKWNDSLEKAYNNIKNGVWDANDFNALFGVRKPFTYGQRRVASLTGDMRVGTQHKCSEALLLAAHDVIAGPTKSSDKLRALNQFMLDNNIDVVLYDSAVKTGKSNVIDLNNTEDYNSVYNTLKQASIEGYIQEIPYEYYGEQTATPEHYIDDTLSLGSQIRRLISSNISPDATFKVGNKTLNKQELEALYNNNIIEGVLDSFYKLKDIFNDNVRLSNMLQEELKKSTEYSSELLKAVTLDNNLEFNTHLFDPIHARRIQSLFNSILKKNVVKQKVTGGGYVQVSSVGMSKDLNIRFKDSSGNLVKLKSEFDSEKSYNEYLKGVGEISMAYYEAYLPWHSEKYIRKMLKDAGVNHNLDINELPDSLRQAIGYRIPTEDKYSMIPIYIKGFLPKASSNLLMLPAEITTVSGTDFDIDKLYLLTPAMETYIDYKALKSDLLKQFKGDYKELFKAEKSLDESIDRIKNNIKSTDKSDNKRDALVSEYINNNYDKYNRISKVNYTNKEGNILDPKELSSYQRNNLNFDLMWSILTSSDTLVKQLNPGGFSTLKDVSSILEALKTINPKELSDNIERKVEGFYNRFKDYVRNNKAPIREINPLSPGTFMYFHKQNMTGNDLIAVYANHKATYATMQNKNITLGNSYNIGTKGGTNFNNLKNIDGKFKSKLIAEFLGASVDNVKDPVLAKLNQNTFTTDATIVLVENGYSIDAIALLLGQPVVEDLTRRFFLSVGTGKSKLDLHTELFNEYFTEYKKVANLTTEEASNSIGNYANTIYSEDRLAIDILKGKNPNNSAAYYKNQLEVLQLFKEILLVGEALSDLSLNTKQDSVSSSPSTIAGAITKLDRVKELDYSSSAPDYKISGINIDGDFILQRNLLDDTFNKDDLRGRLREAKLGFPQAFYTMGLEGVKELFSKYFPYYKNNVRNVIDELRFTTKYNKLSEKTLNDVFYNLFSYFLTKTPLFNKSHKERVEFLQQFPKYFDKVKTTIPDYQNMRLFENIKVMEVKGRKIIGLDPNIKLTDTSREEITSDWESLLYLGPDARDLAINLFMYNYYSNGIGFTPNSFIHLAPLMIREVIPGYREALDNFLTDTDDYTRFVKQYILNHVDNNEILRETTLPDKIWGYVKDNKIGEESVINIQKDDIREFESDEQLPIMFKKTIEGNTYYYSMVESERVGFNKYMNVYKRVYPLGANNDFIEYNYGKEVDNMEVTIVEPKVREDNRLKPLSEYTQEEESSDTIKDYNTMYTGRLRGSNSITQKEVSNIIDGIPMTGRLKKISNKSTNIVEEGLTSERLTKGVIAALENDTTIKKDDTGKEICK